MNQQKADKYFRNEATPEEVNEILKWFKTPGGKRYLEERLGIDESLMHHEEIKYLITNLDSEQLFNSIHINIKRRQLVSKRKKDWLGVLIKTAAAVTVLFAAILFTINFSTNSDYELAEREPVIFQTSAEQNSEITLRDGTIIRLNENTELVISESFLHGKRELELKGEAYFDVAHNSDQPFVINANQSTIEVLGTAFNVRSVSRDNNVQVAVVDGSVSFKSTIPNLEEHTLVLSKGQYGFFDISSQTILADDIAIDNYLSWKSGRLAFEELSLEKVCTQLNRIYNIHCNFEDNEIRNLNLTADFSDKSLHNTLSVIALSLKINFELESDQVYWRDII